MDVNYFFGLIGVASLLFSVWAEFRQRADGGIRVLYFETISFLHPKRRDFPAILVKLNDELISGDLFFMAGEIVNSGRRDIRPEDVHEPLSCSLPEQFRFEHFELVAPKRDQAFEFIDDGSAVDFKLGLFQRSDSVEFRALVSTGSAWPSIMTARRALKWSGKIADTTISIEREGLPGVGPNIILGTLAAIAGVMLLVPSYEIVGVAFDLIRGRKLGWSVGAAAVALSLWCWLTVVSMRYYIRAFRYRLASSTGRWKF